MVGDELHGRAAIIPQMYAPGTAHLRASIVAAWADSITGLLASLAMRPVVPVTLELDVHLYRPAPAQGEVVAVGRTVKAGRSIFVAEVEFSIDEEPFAIGAASFMASPNIAARMPTELSIGRPPSVERLTVPLGQRAGLSHVEPGTVVLPVSTDGLNFSDTASGGLLALVAEEAVLSSAPGATLCALGLRFLRATRSGPVIAQADLLCGVGRVLLRDSGDHDRSTAYAVARLFDQPARPVPDDDITRSG